MEMKPHPAKTIESPERMKPTQAIRYLSTNGYLLGQSPNSIRIAQDARKLAAEMDCSFSPDLRKLFIVCEEADASDACFLIICYLYQKWHARVSKPIRAFASIPNVWNVFLRFTAEQLNILLASDQEEEPFSNGNILPMYFTTGTHMYYEHLMQQIPNHDKRPREIKDDSCFACPGYNEETGKCRFCECQY